MRKLSLLAALALLGGCNTYELDPVKPATAKLSHSPPIDISLPHPPDVVFVVDRSGSMSDAADGTASQVCPGAGQQDLACKWDTLLLVMTGDSANPGFLDQFEVRQSEPNDPVRVGLVTFSGSTNPTSSSADDACLPGVLAVPVGANTASAMSSALEALPPAGATPTAASLQVAASAFPAPGAGEQPRDRVVVLLTDGAPNCNASASISAATCGGDRCTFSCDSSTGLSTDPRGCLDEDGLVSTVAALAQQGIKTMVIGFGADVTSGAAYETLERAAQAGGLPRVDPLSGQPLEPAFYPAGDRASLQAALGQVPHPDLCTFALASKPVSADALEMQVTFCGQPTQDLAPGQWKLASDGRSVTVSDSSLCQQFYASTPDCPTKLQLAYLSQ